jgi:hypothetical protein
MPTTGPIIANAAQFSIMYAESLLKGVTREHFARFAVVNGQVVRSNHPAFVLGHLNLYTSRVMTMLALPEGNTARPAGWEALFKAGVECADDPQGTLYPAMETLVDFYFASHKTAIDAVRQASDETLQRPNPAEGRFKELLPTVGGAVNFLLTGHPMSHLGQVSAWRRMIGLPPA